MLEQIEIDVADSSRIGEVRRAAVRFAQAGGLTETKQGEAAIVATELATNIVRHARAGRILIQNWPRSGQNAVELLAVDSGPGMASVQKCLQDGYSTAGSAGNGLGAIRRLSSEFDVFSNPGQGSVVLSRIGGPLPAVNGVAADWGAVSLAVAGESVSGDAWRFAYTSDGFSLLVADGLGHGPAAHEAAQLAVAQFDKVFAEQPAAVLDRANQALHGSRGAAVAIARYEAQIQTLSYAAIGNICGTLVTNGASRGLMTHNGIVGVQRPRSQQISHDCGPESLLIMHSDGLQTRWKLADYPGLVLRHPAVIAAVLFRDFQRGRDDATVVVVRFPHKKM